ncbi:restriction endonuclease subunit S [Mycoplasmopsis gallinacea]|uniref:Restriction-modification enzyme subunit S1B n=1 Tax=Mycoplasmopsis gallinacea TaxID=29556 RepID=A0A449A3Z3_9BACT|nr:restriction endonuclease subunit S [Mycoplasmopsis gallinacea]VEU58965.1 restriction-modification enzyme subunit S1B [Mycoplasmopsis gallinacea]
MERERESGLIKIIEFIFNTTISLTIKLSNCAQISSGQFVKAQDYSEEFIYPFYNGGRNNSGYHDEYNREGENVLISIRGANAGATNYINDKFWLGNSCVSIQTYKDYDPLFIYFYLTKNIDSLLVSKDGGAIPAISTIDIRNIDIPIIPLQKQKEISNKIKAFHEFVNDLKLGLPKLIELTQIQYQYYRDKIFSYLENQAK